MKKPLRIALGLTLILLGILAAITPFTPGSWLALIGLEILGVRILFEKKLFSWIKEPYRAKLRRLWPERPGRKKGPARGRTLHSPAPYQEDENM